MRSATISVLVENESGVLARVIGLFSGRGYNIDSLTVAPVDAAGLRSRVPPAISAGSVKNPSSLVKGMRSSSNAPPARCKKAARRFWQSCRTTTALH